MAERLAVEFGPFGQAVVGETAAPGGRAGHERGAFALRRSVESVAETIGVSRFTVYNYLDAARGE